MAKKPTYKELEQRVQELEREVEKKLKDGENQFRTLFEQSIDAIIIHENGVIKDVNERACKMLG